MKRRFTAEGKAAQQARADRLAGAADEALADAASREARLATAKLAAGDAAKLNAKAEAALTKALDTVGQLTRVLTRLGRVLAGVGAFFSVVDLVNGIEKGRRCLRHKCGSCAPQWLVCSAPAVLAAVELLTSIVGIVSLASPLVALLTLGLGLTATAAYYLYTEVFYPHCYS